VSILLDCPHCSTRILPMAGRLCPSCRKNVDSPPEPEPKPEQVVQPAYGFAAEQMRHGVAPSQVQKILIERELDAGSAANVVADLERSHAEASRQAGQRNMLIGALWCFGGIALTTMTYQAAAGAGGGRFVVAWGAILFGGIQFLRGFFQSSRR
jgi:hypothetical protein